ncbi:hypothetical protein CCACVL1_04083 [Corchorus capsularis]|uniref:Uncharacterized protein n=1 Tax=Corchorus capsularis TaxID=210143 RepID=A0A1R3JVB3_COCAP|nr:hypothetical protein CCACVL1_04083 [Corchorus capsularis]
MALMNQNLGAQSAAGFVFKATTMWEPKFDFLVSFCLTNNHYKP